MKTKSHGNGFPIEVVRGSGRVTIHRVRKPNGYTYYQLRFYRSGHRQTKSCTDLQDAEKQAAIIANGLHRGESDSILLRGSECAAYRAATAALAPTAVPLDVAARDYGYCHGFRIRAEIAKCREPRLIEVQPNLAAWLTPFRKQSGPVQPFANVTNELADLAKATGICWKHNGLRHGFGSYRLAILKDPAKVAYEMDNSVRMVFKHYRELVTEADATRWFGVMPALPPRSSSSLSQPSGADPADQGLQDSQQAVARQGS